VVSIDRPCFNIEPLIFLFLVRKESHSFNLKNQFQHLKTKNVAYKYLWGTYYKWLIAESPYILWLKVFQYSLLETGSLIFSCNRPPAVD
jgi:hypothetical protein